MHLDEYQREALRTADALTDDPDRLICAALGLTGESGEFADIVKKVAYQGHPLDKVKAIKELGDVLWYVALGAAALGVGLDEVAAANVEKLRKRYPDGFSAERSVNRDTVEIPPWATSVRIEFRGAHSVEKVGPTSPMEVSVGSGGTGAVDRVSAAKAGPLGVVLIGDVPTCPFDGKSCAEGATTCGIGCPLGSNYKRASDGPEVTE